MPILVGKYSASSARAGAERTRRESNAARMDGPFNLSVVGCGATGFALAFGTIGAAGGHVANFDLRHRQIDDDVLFAGVERQVARTVDGLDADVEAVRFGRRHGPGVLAGVVDLLGDHA